MGRIDTDETEGREERGYAWASQAGAVLSNPFASELARDSENPSLIMLHKWPCDASPWNFRGKKPGCAWPAKRNPVFSVFLFDSFAPSHLIRRFSQPAPPSELPCGSLSRLVPKSRFALRANLRLLLIRASLRRLTLRAALAVSRAAAQPPGSAHLPRRLVVYILVI